MTNKVERELIRLREKLCEKYDVAAMNISGSLEQPDSILPDDMHDVVEYWFNVRIRKTNSTNESKIKIITSSMIKSEIKADLGVSLSHNVIAQYMVRLIGKSNIAINVGDGYRDRISYLFENAEIIPIEEFDVMTIFIAQPMSGIPDEEVERIRNQVTNSMIEKYGNKIEIVDQFHVQKEDMPKESLEKPGIYLLGRSIQFLADVDLVVFAGDFLHAKGCCVELAVCKEYDIPFIVYNEN